MGRQLGQKLVWKAIEVRRYIRKSMKYKESRIGQIGKVMFN